MTLVILPFFYGVLSVSSVLKFFNFCLFVICYLNFRLVFSHYFRKIYISIIFDVMFRIARILKTVNDKLETCATKTT